MKHTIQFKSFAALAACGSLMASSATYAAIVVQESFDYTTSQTIGGLNGGTGFSAAWTTPDEARVDSNIASGSLNSTSVTTQVGNHLSFTDDAGSGLSGSRTQRNVDSSLFGAVAGGGDVGGSGGSGTIYISLMLQMSSAGDGGSGFEMGVGGDNDIMALGSDGTDAGVYGLIGKDGRGSIAIAQATMDNLNHFVMRVDYGSGGADDTLTLFMNPVAGNEGAQTALGSVVADWSFDRIGVLNFQNQPGVTVDEIVIGTDFSDVVNVPEPSSAILAGLGLMGLLRRRR